MKHSPFRWVQPFEQIDELAELRRQAVADAQTIGALEDTAADDARVITQMHDILRRQRRAGWWCPRPTAEGGRYLRPGETCECDDLDGHLPLYLRHPKAA